VGKLQLFTHFSAVFTILRTDQGRIYAILRIFTGEPFFCELACAAWRLKGGFRATQFVSGLLLDEERETLLHFLAVLVAQSTHGHRLHLILTA